MKAVLTLLLALVALAHCDEAVLDLNSENWESSITNNPLIAVEFYAPWCGHCKALAPEWEKAATLLQGKVALAKVDCTENQDICQQFEVQGYPTLKLFRNGEASPLEVARKAEPIVAYLNAELEPALSLLKTKEDVEAFLAAHPVAAVGYFDNDHDDRYTAFDQLASKLRHSNSFGVVVNNDLSSDISRPAVQFHRNFDDPIVSYKGEFTSDALASWIARQKVPALGEIGQETYQNYISAGLPIGYLFVNPEEDNTELFSYITEIAKKIRDNVLIAWIDNNKYGQHGVRMGLSGKTVPSLAVEDGGKGVRFLFPEGSAFSSASVQQWVDQFLANELQPHIKSEPVPEDNSGPVKTIVAHTFESIVKDSSKDVLVEFYAPWCGHCKKLAPVWETLGESFSSSPNIVIAKIDATANDVPPQLNIRGFPTILLFPAANKEQPVEYQGSRQLDDLKSFVQEHTGSAAEGTAEGATEEEVHDEL